MANFNPPRIKTIPRQIAFEKREVEKIRFLRKTSQDYADANDKQTALKRRLRHTSASNRKTIVYLPAVTNPDGTLKMTGPLAPKEKEEDWSKYAPRFESGD